MIYLNKKIVLYVLFLLLAVIHFVTTSVVRDNIFTAIENLPRPVKQTKNGALPTKTSSSLRINSSQKEPEMKIRGSTRKKVSAIKIERAGKVKHLITNVN